jgi:hypothetical protein
VEDKFKMDLKECGFDSSGSGFTHWRALVNTDELPVIEIVWNVFNK